MPHLIPIYADRITAQYDEKKNYLASLTNEEIEWMMSVVRSETSVNRGVQMRQDDATC